MGDASKRSLQSSGEVAVKRECPVCFSEFSPNDHRLKLLACTHEVCIGCVKQIDKCPICKERLNVVDIESAEFVSRRGFHCFTCKKRRTSDKMRICLHCSEAKGFLVKPEKLDECSDFIFCSECIIQDHMEQGHRQEKLINYDHEYKTIKQMQKTCLTMKPILEKISNGLEDKADRYCNLMKAMELVLSSEVDVHFADLFSACTTLEKCLDFVNKEAEIDRKFATIWNDLQKSFDEKITKKLQQDNEVILEQKVDSEVKIRALQEEIEGLHLKLNEKIEEHNKEKQKWKEEIKRLAEELSKSNEVTSSKKEQKYEMMRRMDVFLKREEAEELRKQQEAEELQKQKEAEELQKQKEAEELRKQKEAEKLRKQKEAEELRKQKEAEELRKQEEAEELRKQQEEKERKLQEALNNPETVWRFDNPYYYGWTITPSSINRLYISVTKPMYLCGIGMDCSTTQTDARFTIRITGPNNVDTSGHGTASDNITLTRVMLETPLQMTPGCKYLFDLTIDKQCELYYGKGGTSRIELEGHPGYVVEFSNCEGSETTVEKGLFYKFFFAPFPC